MRYIETNGIAKPPRWLKDARRHTHIVKKKTTIADKKLYIKGQNSFWGKFKPELEHLSEERCWFTESPEWVGFFHVEHFNPKGKVDPLKPEVKFVEFQRPNWDLGYWWLAFNWKNYRLACSVVNSSHKRNYFPLGIGSSSAVTPVDNHIIESQILIDPCVEYDVNLISYNMWEVVETADQTTNLDEYERARVSIEVYGLNKHEKLVNARKGVLKRCNKLLKRANYKFDEMMAIFGYASIEYLRTFSYFQNDCEDLRKMIDYKDSDALFPTMILTRIKTSGYNWVDDFILN